MRLRDIIGDLIGAVAIFVILWGGLVIAHALQ